MGFVRRLARAVIDIDWSAVSPVAALRGAVLCVVVLSWAVAGNQVVTLTSAVIGTLMVSVVDPPATERRRLTTMGSFALWGGLAALLGGLVSGSFAVLLVVGVLVALVSGYAGAIGPTGSVVGMLSLVVFSIFSGTPVALDHVWRNPLVFVAGVAFGATMIMLPSLMGRARCSRQSFARLARSMRHTEADDPLAAGAALPAMREREFIDMVNAEQLTPAAQEWFGALGADAHRARLGMLGLAPRLVNVPDAERDAVVAFVRAAGRCWGATATVVTWRWRRRILTPALARLDETYAALGNVGDPATLRVATAVHGGLHGLAATLLGDWPRRALPRWTSPTPSHHWTVARNALRAHLHFDDPFARHALRLAVTFGAALALAEALGFPHPYWVSMTVAWISRPTMGDTTVRVSARVAGTAAGVIVSGVIVSSLDPGQWALVALMGVSALVAVAFIPANYAIGIAGVTPFLFFLMVLDGEGAESSLLTRLVAALMAGLLVLLAAAVWPTRSGTKVDTSLGAYADALAKYAAVVLDHNDLDPETQQRMHSELVVARTTATADLHAADFEVGRHRLHPETAHVVLESLHAATAYCLACELAGPGPDDRAAAPSVPSRLAELQQRLVSDAAAPVPSPAIESAASDHPVHRSIRMAHEALDRDGTRHQRHASGEVRHYSGISRG